MHYIHIVVQCTAFMNCSKVILKTKSHPRQWMPALHDWQIDWEASRIILPVRKGKIDTIKSIMRQHSYSTGIFVDDQQDHLRCEPGIGLECRLAEWAYGGAGTVFLPGVERISLEGLCELVASFGS